jgi:hypothetical protein
MAQFPGLSAGTVTATVGGGAVSTNVSIAVVDEDGTLVLTALSNDVQIQIPGARVGSFDFVVDANGGLVGPILSLRANGRMITPVSGSIAIESLSGENATGSFAFEGIDLETEAAVSVTDGRFDVRLTGGG